MRPMLALRISEDTGMPCAQIPQQFVWELVEYLSLQRVRVTYAFNYSIQRFTVSFPRTELESAQQILNEWTCSEALRVPECVHREL